MTNNPMMEDRERDLWRKQWSNVTQPSREFQREVQERIRVHDRRFWLGNLLAVAASAGMLILAIDQFSHPASALERDSAAGLCALLSVAVACRLWIMRGTWRAETRSIRAFVELWHRRVLAQIRGLQIGTYLAFGWLLFCLALAVGNWATIKVDVMAHPTACLVLMVIIALMLPVIWFGVMGLRRRKVAELNEATKLLEEWNQ